MSLSEFLITTTNQATVCLCTPGILTPFGYVTLRPRQPIPGFNHHPLRNTPTVEDVETPEIYSHHLYFRISGLSPGVTQAQLDDQVLRHVATVLHMEKQTSEWEVTEIRWFSPEDLFGPASPG